MMYLLYFQHYLVLVCNMNYHFLKIFCIDDYLHNYIMHGAVAIDADSLF